MLRLSKILARTLSFRLSLMVLVALATLLMAALFIMFGVSRHAVKDEALQKAGQTLEATVQRIDNILLGVEQASGNIYWKLLNNINQPDKMYLYSRKLVESSPYITGCAIAFEPGFYEDGQLFMAYFHRLGNAADSTGQALPIVQSDTFGNRPYTEQAWFTTPMQKGVACWIDPLKGEHIANKKRDDALTSFCLPIFHKERRVGVLAVDISLPLLSRIVLETKPSPNSYCTLLGKDGSYIVHPDDKKLNRNVFDLAKEDPDPSVEEAAKAMVSGNTGYQYVRLQGEDCYVFYKPFERAEVPGRVMTELGWSAGIVYPEDDIFGDYNLLLYTVLIIAVTGLLLLLLLCQTFIHRQLLPLRMLSKSAQRIAEGCYDEAIPESRHHDEVGRLQNHFQQMQQSLNTRMSELQRLSDTLKERGEALQAAYEQAQMADQMKTNFLYNMSNQMMKPVNTIYTSVRTISEHYNNLSEEETFQQVDEIQRQGATITALLNQLIKDSEE